MLNFNEKSLEEKNNQASTYHGLIIPISLTAKSKPPSNVKQHEDRNDNSFLSPVAEQNSEESNIASVMDIHKKQSELDTNQISLPNENFLISQKASNLKDSLNFADTLTSALNLEGIPRRLRRYKLVNKKRLSLLISLIDIASTLIKDKIFLNKLYQNFDLSSDKLDDQKTENQCANRETIIHVFKTTLPEIIDKLTDDYDQDFIKFDSICCRMISVLHELVLKDFIEKNIPDIIHVLIEHEMSPITLHYQPEVSSKITYSEKEIRIIQKRQNIVRSMQRASLHLSLFGRKPQYFKPLPVNIKNNQKLVSIIHELTVNHAIIGNIQEHWTTESNLKSIVRNQHFYANGTLRNQKLFFQKNALEKQDKENGDGNVICFCPFMVDYLAFYDNLEKECKKNVVRLSIDINKAGLYGKYNQFFKLFDLCAPDFNYMVRVNCDLSISITRRFKDGLVVTIFLKGTSKRMKLAASNKSEKHEIVCYGNLFSINRFCILALFDLLNKCNDAVFEKQFLDYLSALDVSEVKKVIILFAQSLTLFSEYNFNISLINNISLIQSLHYVEKSLTFDLAALTKESYHRSLNNLVINDEVALEISSVHEKLLTTVHDNLDERGVIFLYGNKIDTIARRVDFGEQDFTQISAESFNTDAYIETRPRQVENTPVSKAFTL